MKITRIEAASIPALWIEPHLSNLKEAIILYHGYASNKERMQFLGEIFAMKGYHVFIPDLPRHGERGGNLSHDKESKRNNFWPVIFEAAEEGHAFLNAIKKNWAVHSRFNLVGESMGGFITPAILARSPLPVAAASINASCSWTEAERLFRLQDGRRKMTEAEIAEFSHVDPSLYFSKSPLKPLLLMHGTADQFVPIEAQEHFYKKMTQGHSNFGACLSFKRKHGVNHFISYGMIEEILAWLSAKNSEEGNDNECLIQQFSKI